MLTDTELIRKLEFFEPLDQKIIKRIADLCIVREFSAGEAIVRQGESGLGLYFITGGKVKVEIERDGAKVVVAELNAGEFLGEFSLIDEKTRSANVICLQDTRCLLLTRDSLAKVMTKYPEIANQMLRTLVSRIRSTNERITRRNWNPLPTPGANPALNPMSNLMSQALPPLSPPSAHDETAAPENNGRSSIAAVSEQIASLIPKPEDMVQFYSSTKGKTQDYLNRFVSTIYAMKAMMRFSMAIVGCPVTVSAENSHPEILEACCNGVHLILFPADGDQTIRIEAIGDGAVSATVYRPAGTPRNPHVEVLRLAGPIREKDVLRLHMPAGQPMAFEASRDLSNESSGTRETEFDCFTELLTTAAGDPAIIR